VEKKKSVGKNMITAIEQADKIIQEARENYIPIRYKRLLLRTDQSAKRINQVMIWSKQQSFFGINPCVIFGN